MPHSVPVLSAGAAQGLITRAAPLLLAQADAVVTGRFGAVGAMKDAFASGEPCDIIVLTAAMIDAMIAAGDAQRGSDAPLGTVFTGIAVPAGAAHPDVSDTPGLSAAFERAGSIWLPDIERSTAGLHAIKVLRELGLAEKLSRRLRIFPNGATAMRAMAVSGEADAIGCTQLSEILFTQGVSAVGRLPSRFELGTVYTAAVTARAQNPTLARALIASLTAPAAAELRRACGFE